MSDKLFFDTNLLVYMFDKSHKEKQLLAKRLVLGAFEDQSGVISYQVVQEFLSLATRKFRSTIAVGQDIVVLRELLDPLCKVSPDMELFEHGLQIHGRYKYSFYDSLIIAAALKVDCKILYSEDMRHGQQIDELKIINPFA